MWEEENFLKLPRVHCSDTLWVDLFIYLFGVLRRFQHCTGHITTGSWKGRGNHYIEFARVLYCKLPTNGKQLPAFPLEAVTGIEPRPRMWEARVLPLCHRGPSLWVENFNEIPLSHTVKEIEAILCFASFGKNSKIKNGRHFWGREKFLKIAKSTLVHSQIPCCLIISTKSLYLTRLRR